jgi:hypothetical protein
MAAPVKARQPVEVPQAESVTDARSKAVKIARVGMA